MANQNNQNKGTEQQVAEQQVQQVPEQQQPQQVQQPVVIVQTEKEGIGAWFKRHWKGVVGAVTGALAVGGSAVVAYKKGKQAGFNSMPQQQDDCYSLNPNE